MGDETIKTISQETVAGEVAGVRLVDPTSPQDMEILKQIDEDPAKIFWFESVPGEYKPMTTEQLAEFASDTNDHLLFAVSGSLDSQESERGVMQGWIKANPDDPSRVTQLKELGVIPDGVDPIVVEVSYVTKKGALPHQMSSALRQVCFYHLPKLLHESYPDLPPEDLAKRVYITAYVQDKLDPHTGLPNNASINVLKNSCFIARGEVQYDTEAKTKDGLFVLDWGKLIEKEEPKVLKALEADLGNF